MSNECKLLMKCKLQAERPWLGYEPPIIFLQNKSANNCSHKRQFWSKLQVEMNFLYGKHNPNKQKINKIA